ncbi:3-hydroxyacyl-CoA dehydrogenase family protein [Chachezhania sediminis]|uniref:3-hydroxyacyl-CoA dehydrogenase family protein n=1 Tax=Chachezhania sediminis TaxID=2599291 RepID=UPI0018EF25AC|nr:3-hydroxyacyl-CoA dehydrogenase NAD-binding domain-containing protein [Chachezhania sediminis]
MTRVAILGGGLIGAGWAAAFAVGGAEAVVVDPDPSADARIAAAFEAARGIVAQLGNLSDMALLPRRVDLDQIRDVDLLQEALPEDLELKHRVLTETEPFVAPDAPIASSSSSFTADRMAPALQHPERLLIGHPCNPPYLMPVVEIVGGTATTPDTLARARAIYEGIGKTVLTLKKPVPGHLVNRLQAAIWREAVHMVVEGIADLPDTERAVTHALGPRWSLVGPHTVFALSGAEGGMGQFLKALAGPMQGIFDDLGTPRLDAATCAALADAYAASDLPPLDRAAALRDRTMPDLLRCAAEARAAEDETPDRLEPAGGTTERKFREEIPCTDF